MAGPFYLGVDGGGTHTVALLSDAAGQVLGRGLAGPSNLHAVGEAVALAALAVAADAALAPCPRARGAVAVACLGLAGAGRARERDTFAAWAGAARLAERILIVTDGELVLAAGTPAGWGLAIIAGTGSIAWGRSPSGELARAGGWGYLLGDEGSGYAVGLAALRAVARAADGRGPATVLTSALLAHWGLPGPEALIGHVYRQTRGKRAGIAALAPLVEQAAGEGDAVAVTILREAGEQLACALGAVAARLGLEKRAVPCALGGGLLVHGRAVARETLAAAARRGYTLAPVTRVAEPALGALRLARGEISCHMK